MRTIQIISPAECKAARSFLNWSLKDLSAKAEIKGGSLVNFETGRTGASIIIMDNIISAFNKEGVFFEENEEEIIIKFRKKK